MERLLINKYIIIPTDTITYVIAITQLHITQLYITYYICNYTITQLHMSNVALSETDFS